MMTGSLGGCGVGCPDLGPGIRGVIKANLDCQTVMLKSYWDMIHYNFGRNPEHELHPFEPGSGDSIVQRRASEAENAAEDT